MRSTEGRSRQQLDENSFCVDEFIAASQMASILH